MTDIPPAWTRSATLNPSISMPGSRSAATSLSALEPAREALRQSRGPHLGRSRAPVVGDAVEGEGGAVGVEHGVAGGGVPVARLPRRAHDGEPAAMGRQRD